jgi:glycine dehydrogenase subunit 1
MENACALRGAMKGMFKDCISFSGPTFNEFVIRTPLPAKFVLEALAQRNIYGGIALSKDYRRSNPNDILVAVTEMNRLDEVFNFVNALKEVSQ